MARRRRRGSSRRRRGGGLRLLGWLFALLVLAVLAVPVIVAVAVIDDRPLVVDGVALDAAQAQRAKALAKRTINRVLRAEGLTTLAFSESDVNSLFAFAGRGARRLKGRANLGDWGLQAAATVRLPRTPLGQYVNVRAGLAPSTAGIRVTEVAVGSLELSGASALLVVRLALDRLLGDGEGTAILDSVKTVTASPDRLEIGFLAGPEQRERLAAARARLGEVRDELALLGDPQRVAVYYRRIVELSAASPPGRHSLAWYMGPLFELARSRSAGGDPATENRALVLALAMYFGDRHFEAFIGNVRDEAMRAHRPRTKKVRLAGREDLRLHFLISAGLEIATERGLSDAIGELKELLDTGKGGTGFSFVDLAADRAGVHFAELATGSRGGAERMQRLLAGEARESAFFPDTAGLEEGMKGGAFERRYGGLEDPRYVAVVADIDRRIGALPLYR